MVKPAISEESFIEGLKTYGPSGLARRLGQSERTVHARKAAIEARMGVKLTITDMRSKRPPAHVQKTGYRIIENVTGKVIVFSDGHFWPGERSVAFDALIKLIASLKPSMVICNGDAFDGARISRHPPGGWNKTPDVADELQAVQERLGEIEAVAAPSTKLIWTAGNHDSRFTSRLAERAPEYMRVHGMDITDHFPAWVFAWSAFLNDKVVVKHRHHSGVHGAYNNVLKGGKSIVTGHTHRLQAVQWGDYNGLRFGIECGTLSDYGPENDKFAYAEDAPLNWSQGFVVLSFDRNGDILDPEFCRVKNGVAYFRSEAVR